MTDACEKPSQLTDACEKPSQLSDACEKPSQLIAAITAAGLDTVEGAFAYQGGEDFDKPGLGHRRRTRITLFYEVDEADKAGQSGQSHTLYLKRYGREPFKTRLGRFIATGRFTSAAEAEFANIKSTRSAGIGTMIPVICGADSLGRSYLVVTSVPGDAIERCFEKFLAGSDAPAIVQFTKDLACLVLKLHSKRLVHRDLYASHIFLEQTSEGPQLYLIDLARLFSPRLRFFRWRVKDLAQLKYSMPGKWIDRYWPVFMDTYLEGSPSAGICYQRAIDRKVARMSNRTQRKVRDGKLKTYEDRPGN